MAYYHEIKAKIFKNIQFRKMEKDKDSYYTEIGSVLVIVSNHCTHMKTWEQIFNNNPKLRNSKILSIVFEDTADTFIPECLFQVYPKTPSIDADEYVYRIHGNGTFINSSDINVIIKALRDIAYGNYYNDPTEKSEYFHRKSFFPDYGNIEITPDGRSIPAGFNGVDYPIEESKNYKNIKKNVQRINESQLRAIIAESVKKVLRESEEYGVFDALSSDRHPEDGIYIRYNGEFYHIPNEMANNYDFTTRDGRREIVNAIRNGALDSKEPMQGAVNGSWGYKTRGFNADAL